MDEHPVNAQNGLDFFRRTRHQDNAISLEAFMFTASQFAFGSTTFVLQHAAQTKSCGTSLAIAKFNKSALTREDFDR